MTTVDLLISFINNAFNEWRQDENGRHRSWEHCYKNFHDARHETPPDCDYLSLQLAFYLASWGMYRGSSFLLQKDYKVHIPIVEEILKPQYDCLCGLECKTLRDSNIQDCLKNLEQHLVNHYEKIRKNTKGSGIKTDVSTTLITKILMGTLGCVPAYDRYFVYGVRSQQVTTGNYNMDSLLKLADFYERDRSKLEAARKHLKAYDLLYPQMKLLDVGFWLLGIKGFMEKK